LFRNWKNRVKGRDWYDFEWYVKRSTSLNLNHLTIRAKESGNLQGNEFFTKELFLEVLHEKIDILNIKSAKDDIKRFIADDRVLDIWSKEYFHLLTQRIKFIEEMH